MVRAQPHTLHKNQLQMDHISKCKVKFIKLEEKNKKKPS